MKKKTNIYCTIRSLVSGAALVLAAYCLPLTTCPSFGAFQDSGWGVRPLGMGGAFTAVADDSNGQLYNPAGLAFVPQEELSVMSAQLYTGLDTVNIGLNYLGYVKPVSGKFGNLGFVWGSLSATSLYREDTASLGYGRFVNDVFGLSQPAISVGANVKYIKHEYTLDVRTVDDPVFAHGNSAAATAFDVGVMASWEKLGLNVALACKNVNSPDVGLLTVDKVPNENVLGFSYYTAQLPFLKIPDFTSALDIVSRDNQTDVRFGVESWMFDSKFALRAGASQENITFGLGYEISISAKTKLIIDYSFAWPLQIENTSGSHRFGLSVCLP